MTWTRGDEWQGAPKRQTAVISTPRHGSVRSRPSPTSDLQSLPPSHPLHTPSRVSLLRGAQAVSLWLSLLGTLALAGALRWWRLGAQNLWLGEAQALAIARMPWAAIIAYAHSQDANPPGYYLALRLWMSLWGQSQVADRALSAASGVATALALYLIVARLVSKPTGILAALLLAVNPTHLIWSQQVGPFALTCLLTCLYALALAGALRRPRQIWRWALWAFIGLTLVYTQYAAIAIVFCFALVGCATLRNRLYELVCLWVGAALSVALALLMSGGLPQALAYSSTNVAGDVTLTSLTDALVYMSASNAPPYLAYLVTAPLAGFVVLGIVTLLRARRVRSAGFLLVWLLGVPLVLFLASYIRGAYLPQFALMSLPAFCACLAVGGMAVARRARKDLARGVNALRLRRRRLSRRLASGGGFGVTLAIVVVALLTVNATLDARYFMVYQSEQWGSLATYISEHQAPGDVILLANPYGYTEPAFDAYYRSAPQTQNLRLPERAVPDDWNGRVISDRAPSYDAQSAVGRLRVILQGRQRIWVVTRDDKNEAWAASLVALIPPWYRQAYIRVFPSAQEPLTLTLLVSSNSS